MLRLFAIFLLLANVSYYAWSGGWLRSWGLAPTEESEPLHWAQQIAPEALHIVPAAAQAPAPAATPDTAPAAAEVVVLSRTVTPPPVAASRGECLQAGPFDPAEAEAWRKAASILPQGSWRLESTPVPGRWMIYMGRFADADVLAKKRLELRIRKVAFDRPNNPELEPGLSLGRFPTEAAAERGLANLGNKGVRTARVLQEHPDSEIFTLRLPLVDAALQNQLARLQAALAGKPLRSCFTH
jgi:hypothetical protein